MNNHGKMKKEQMKNGRVYLFADYLRGLSSAETKIFADICRFL